MTEKGWERKINRLLMIHPEKATFGDKIRLLRYERRIYIEEAAAGMGISVPTLSKWEGGYNHPRFEELKCVKKFYNASLDWLITGE